jgi:hypothetical protein
MGVDQIASGIVARDLRGKLGPVDWQIDTILPASRRAFALDALPDFDQMFPGISEDCRNTDCTNHWSEVYARADALLTLPAHWRKSEGPPHTPCDDVIVPEDWGEPLDCPEPDHTLDHTLAAEFLIRQIDALIIIWDGKPGAGPGGTPDIASAALEQGLPVIHIDPTDASMEPRMLTRVLKADAPRGIRNWYARAIDLECEEADARKGAIREGLQRVLGFPAAKQQSAHAAGHVAARGARVHVGQRNLRQLGGAVHALGPALHRVAVVCHACKELLHQRPPPVLAALQAGQLRRELAERDEPHDVPALAKEAVSAPSCGAHMGPRRAGAARGGGSCTAFVN